MKRAAGAALVALATLLPTGCGSASPGLPGCGATERLGLIAQSVPSAGYLPCITALPVGWHSSGLLVESGRTQAELTSDRAAGHPVRVRLSAGCDPGPATALPPRSPGGRSYLLLSSIAPRYSGMLFDVFPGGCVTYRFDFARDRHIALMAELQSAVGLLARRQLRLELRRELGIELGP